MIGEQQGQRSYRRKKTKSLVAGSRYKSGRYRGDQSYNITVLAADLKKKKRVKTMMTHFTLWGPLAKSFPVSSAVP